MNKKVTMKDIADKLNISINAVSLALNNRVGVSEETRKIVLNTADELGYLEKSNKFIDSFASKNICIITKSENFRDNYFYSKILLGIEQEARKKGYDMIANFIGEDEYEMPLCIVNKKVCGIIIVGSIDDEYLTIIKEYKIPIILVDHTSLIEDIDSILTNNKSGAFKATKLLMKNNFKEIGFFGDLHYSFSIKERFFGYQEAIKSIKNFNNIEEVDSYINKRSILSNLEEHIIEQDSKAIAKKLKEIDILPKAFVCSNDNAAIQLIYSLNELGYSVPKDISVVGFDDISLGTMIKPKLTTLKVDKELMGKRAIDKLIWRIENKNNPIENIIMEVQLIDRESVKKID